MNVIAQHTREESAQLRWSRFSPPVSNNSGTSTSATGAPDRSASSRNFLREAPSIGCTICSSCLMAAGSFNTRAESLLRSTLPLTVVPGNAASTAGAASPS